MVQVEVASQTELAFRASGWSGVPAEEASSFHLTDLAPAPAAAGSSGRVRTRVEGTRLLALLERMAPRSSGAAPS